MDASTFDRLTRLLAGRLTRRAGVAGALAALAAGTPATSLELEARRRRGQDRRQRAGEPNVDVDVDVNAGIIDEKKPCGPKPSDNRCRKHKQCCTGYCRKPKKGKKSGRCRCIKPGKKCRNGQTCCGGSTCQNRRCTPMPAPNPAPACGAVGGPCDDESDCCTGLICEKGACAPCVETVCASGCAATSIEDAYDAADAGDTIYLGKGTYATGIAITKDITFAACPGVTGVILTPDRVLMNPSDSYYVVFAEDETDTSTRHAVTLRNLTFQATTDGVTNEDEIFLYSFDSSLIDWTIDGCTMSGAAKAMFASLGEHAITDSTFTEFTYWVIDQEPEPGGTSTAPFKLTMSGCTLADNDSYGVYFYPYSTSSQDIELLITDSTFSRNASYQIDLNSDPAHPKQKFSIENTTVEDGEATGLYIYSTPVSITGCTITGNQDTGLYITDSDVTLTDCTVQGNHTAYSGGGVYLEAGSYDATLTIAGTTTITGNTVESAGSGGGIYRKSKGKTDTVIGSTTSNVTGNTVTPGGTPDNCARANVVVNCGTWT